MERIRLCTSPAAMRCPKVWLSRIVRDLTRGVFATLILIMRDKPTKSFLLIHCIPPAW
jgi:hypothetical protein